MINIDGEEVVLVTIIGCVTVFLVCLMFLLVNYYKHETKLHTENGYEKVMLNGYSSPVYRKIKKDS